MVNENGRTLTVRAIYSKTSISRSMSVTCYCNDSLKRTLSRWMAGMLLQRPTGSLWKACMRGNNSLLCKTSGRRSGNTARPVWKLPPDNRGSTISAVFANTSRHDPEAKSRFCMYLRPAIITMHGKISHKEGVGHSSESSQAHRQPDNTDIN